MRISDWSSDVCSSDLSSIRRVIARDEAPGSERAPRNSGDILDLRDEQADVPEAETAEAEELVSTSSADAARQSLEALSAAITPASAAPAPAKPVPGGRTMEEVVIDALRPMRTEQIGRASCRERGCKYV